MKKLFTLFLAACCMLGLLTACTGGAPTPSADPTPAGATPNAAATAAAGQTEQPAKAEKVVFTFARNEDILTFDKYNTTNVINDTLGTALFDTLLKSDHAGTFSPNLATEWTSSEDGLVWTIKLRDDVYFHNGEKFTSESVKYTFERGI